MNMLTFIFIVLLAVGLFLMFEATGLRDFEIEYGDYCSQNTDKYGTCLLKITPPEDLVSPCLYYRLDDFNANHRSFVKSRSWKQLAGKDITNAQSSTCTLVTKNSDLLKNNWMTESQLPTSLRLKQGELANPCGLIALYHFDDEF